MIEFEKNYYDEEVRLGYTIDPLKKRNWAALLEVLAEIDRVCKKHNITYFADWGTLLGAVRHKGFIPWDDDLDICMKREDYEKFQRIIPLEFQDFEGTLEEKQENKLYCFSPLTAGRNMTVQTVVCNNNHIDFTDEHLKRYHGYPFVACIDVFPMDYVPADSPETETIYSIIKILDQIVFNDMLWDKEFNPINEDVVNSLKQIANLMHYKIDFNDKLRRQGFKLIDSLSKMYKKKNSKYITCVPRYSNYRERNHRYKKEWYDEVIYVPFENIEIPIPAEYDKILTVIYGDYMTPVIYDAHGDDHRYQLETQFDFKGQDPMEFLYNKMKDYD